MIKVGARCGIIRVVHSRSSEEGIVTTNFRSYLMVALLTFALGQFLTTQLRADDQATEQFSAGAPGDPEKPARVIQVSMYEKDGAMAYSPAEIEVALGEQVRFVITNDGEQLHEFHLASFDENAQHKIEMEKHPAMQHDDVNAQSVEPGKKTEILWKFSKRGSFEFACFVPGHYSAGMHGKVVVK